MLCEAGEWSGWSDWGQWSHSCGDVARFRSRECVTDCPCSGDPRNVDTDKVCCRKDAVNCTLSRFPSHVVFLAAVDGGWDVVVGNWSSKCGWVHRTVNRSCTNPPPSCNGKDCEGLSTYTETSFRSCGILASVYYVWHCLSACLPACVLSVSVSVCLSTKFGPVIFLCMRTEF